MYNAKVWPLGCLVVFLSWLALAGCGSTAPAPTLVPTLALPTPFSTPPPLSTQTVSAALSTATALATGFPTWRSGTLRDGESFDFRQETTGFPTQGDLYYAGFDSLQGTACFWANNADQVGGRDVGSWPLTALTERPLPRERFSKQCLPVTRGHVYVYGLKGDERLAVLRVSETSPDWVTFEYVLRK